ncbi:MAG: glycosyltransferase family 2 protein [Acidobacteria bacterium]|nr:glycosyltransferase family 2 protein [Acidobacteriota bacterium]
MTRPTLALCVPAFNAASFLPRLLRSAASQAIAFDDIVVVDDASSDDTARVAESLGARVIRNEQNRGCSASKNVALAHASCDWVHFHDADDELLPTFTQRAHEWMGRGDAPDVVLFNYEYRDNTTGELLSRSDFDDAALQADPLRYAITSKIINGVGIYRRPRLEDVGGFDENPAILFNEDVAFHCKLAAAGLNFRADSAVTVINHRIGGSMSQSNAVRCERAHVAVMKRVYALCGESYFSEIADRLMATATILAAHREWQAVDEALAVAEQIDPSCRERVKGPFGLVTRVIGSRGAYRVREGSIRLLKPHLRRGMT